MVCYCFRGDWDLLWGWVVKDMKIILYFVVSGVAGSGGRRKCLNDAPLCCEQLFPTTRQKASHARDSPSLKNLSCVNSVEKKPQRASPDDDDLTAATHHSTSKRVRYGSRVRYLVLLAPPTEALSVRQTPTPPKNSAIEGTEWVVSLISVHASNRLNLIHFGQDDCHRAL